MIKICEHCGKEFTTTKKRSKFCSRKCMGMARTKYPEKRLCAFCGKEIYHNKRYGRINKFCSLECYAKSNIKSNDNYEIIDNYVKVFVLHKGETFEVLLDIDDFERFKEQRIVISKKPKDTTYYASINKKRLHRLVMGCPKNKIIDHINHNGLDNRKENLRITGYIENNLNRNLAKNNKSGCKGVCYREKDKAWRVHYRGKEIGYFKNLEDAIQCRKEAEQKDIKYI